MDGIAEGDQSPPRDDSSAVPSHALVEQRVSRWIAAWTQRATDELFRLMAAGTAIESNLDPDGDFIELLLAFAGRLDRVAIAARTVVGNRVALVYECTLGGETFRLAEFLELDERGLITAIRRVYDLATLARLMPDLPTG